MSGWFQMVRDFMGGDSTAQVFAVIMLAGFAGFGVGSYNFFIPRSEAAEHVTKAELQEVNKSINEAIEGVKRTAEQASEAVTELSSEWRIADAIQTFDQAETALYLHTRDEKVNGVTPESEERRHQLQRRMAQAQEYKDCVMAGRNNCGRLRPR